MIQRKKNLLLLTIIILLGAFLRFYQLGNIPPGAYIDEASQGYNAYTILLTGKDEWGESFPVFLRSFGTYPSPLNTYLLIIPIKIFGLSILTLRTPTAIIGILIMLLTYLLIYFSTKPRLSKPALFTTLVIAISPWAVLYSRLGMEVNLGLFLLLIGFVLSLFIEKKPWLFILIALSFAIATYAYTAERVMSVIFLAGIVYYFRKLLWENKKILAFGIILFSVLLLPQLFLLNTPGAIRRYSQQNFLNREFYNQNGKFQNIIFGEQLYYAREFASQYIAYFSPSNLFSNPDSQLSRSSPNLSVFYLWMIIPFFIGIPVLWKNRNIYFFKLVIFVTLTSLIPAAITRDPFYTSRILPFLWAISIIIGLGVTNIYERVQSKTLRVFGLFLILGWSLISLYSSYFVLMPHERSSEFGYQYKELTRILQNYKDQEIILNTDIEFPTYIMMAFYMKYDPVKMQSQTKNRLPEGYYNHVGFDEKYTLDNITITPDIWTLDKNKSQILVGTPVAISPSQAESHNLSPIFTIRGLDNQVLLEGFQTNP